MSDFDPPPHLSERAKKLWQAIVPDRARSPGRLVLVLSALESLDRADQARQEIATTGMVSVTATTKAIHVHPLVKVERESRQQFHKIWASMNLGWDFSQDGISLDRFLSRQKENADDALSEIQTDDVLTDFFPALSLTPKKRTAKKSGTPKKR